MQSLGSHILGAEITYQHIKDYKYKAFITVYRDCNECKIAGEGGGTNTKDCGQFYLYLSSSTRNGCTAKSLTQFSLTRQSIQKVLPICASAMSKCSSDSGLNYGVEAHTFTTEIDFNNYKSYERCGFDMYVQLATRADDIDNLSQSSFGETLYNYSYIDPFVKHSSPTFSNQPEILLTVNQASRSIVMDDVSGDSISIHFAKPLRGAGNEIDYQTGYFLQRPLSVWCNGDVVNCEANPNANPPVGVTLDPTIGYLAFTPIKNSEKASLVIEVDKYQKTSSGMHLISVVRRDILVEVTSIGQHNNPPQLFGTSINKSTNYVDACAGAKICFDIQAQDVPYIFPDGSYQSANTVSYEWLSQLPNAEIKEVTTSTAPFKKLSVCWTPDISSVGKTFELNVTASDDNCPINASASTKYYIKVNDLPSNHLRIHDLWCGSIGLEGDSTGSFPDYKVEWTLLESNQDVYFNSVKAFDTIQFDKPLNGQLVTTITDDLGCKRTVVEEVSRAATDLAADFGELLGNSTYCSGDSARLVVKQSNGVAIHDLLWLHNDDTVSETSRYNFLASYQETADLIQVLLSGSKGNLDCKNVLSKEIKVDKGLEVEILGLQPVCEGSTTHLDLTYLPSVKGGNWEGINHNLFDGNVLDLTKLGDITEAVEVCQVYTTESMVSGCTSHDTLCVWVMPQPSLNLKKTTICGASGYFNLINMDPGLFSFGSHDISWVIDGVPLADNPQGNEHLIQLTGLPIGDHQVVGVYKTEFGCETSDTAILSLLDDIDLSYVANEKICQGDTRDLSSIFNIKLGGGIWTSLNEPTDIINNHVAAETCGDLDLLFTYDQFGCFVNKEVGLNVVCKPTIEFDLHDTICAFTPQLELSANPAIGTFIGEDVVRGRLNITSDDKTYDVTYRVVEENCVFNYAHQMTVVPAPTFSIATGVPNKICEGQQIVLNPIEVNNGALRVHFSKGDTIFYTGSNVFSYNPSLKEIGERQMMLELKLLGNGYCPTNREPYRIKINPKAKIDLIEPYFVGCTPFVFKPKFVYDAERVNWALTQTEWDFGGAQKPSSKLEPSTTYKNAGTYSISVHTVSPKGCVYNKTWLNAVEVHESPNASFRAYPSGEVSVANPLVKFNNTSTATDSVTYQWNFGTGMPADISSAHSPSFNFGADTGTFNVRLIATTSNGCTDEYNEKIRVLPDIQIFVPTAFSPNGKGSEITEEFKVVGTNVSRYYIEIFNRWGEQVYASDNLSEEWGGKSGGRYCKVGIYAYLIKATSTSGRTYELKGTINIVR